MSYKLSRRERIRKLIRAKLAKQMARKQAVARVRNARTKKFNQREFDEWMEEVSDEVIRISGLSAYDLADMPYADWFNDGMTPDEAANLALDNEGFY